MASLRQDHHANKSQCPLQRFFARVLDSPVLCRPLALRIAENDDEPSCPDLPDALSVDTGGEWSTTTQADSQDRRVGLLRCEHAASLANKVGRHGGNSNA